MVPAKGTVTLAELDPPALVEADEALLSRGGPSASVTILRSRGLSVGFGQRDLGPLADRARAEGLTVVTRSTGGTAVLCEPGDLAWSLVLPAEDARVGRDYARGYARLGAAVVRALQTHLPRVRWSAAPALSPTFCLLGSRGQVLEQDGRVFGGAAQRLARRTLLHHGVILRRRDPALVGRLFGLDPALVERRLAGWEELGVRDSSRGLAERVRRSLTAELAVDPGERPPPPP